MQQDYRFDCLNNTSKEELTELAMRMLHRLVPEPVVREIFHFEEQETATEERQQEAYFDATLRLHAVALGEIPSQFAQSQNAEQNIERMCRLILWHFYAIGFQLDRVIPLMAHCQEIEQRVSTRPNDALEWSTALTQLLYRYSEMNQAQAQSR
ncbi:exoribonuclease R [Vibrio porteresiae]|uniref:Exoribonuclease R n=1 Tax=Vibrio porteresiae DSM 19223 TaxID=1123496 RepID=A0ABZ0QI15_9VIBR|nr:exoribonuclease R [Vibrio porteresiae]WPC76133.1 exoribonuclease R [Vibrio porteresiae DSM 19223]